MTRKDAIKIVQNATIWTDEERTALAILIPEFAKTEDDGIRKEIELTLSLFVADNDSALYPGAHYTVKEAIDWLEKQKDV